jgi:hypothetical protein
MLAPATLSQDERRLVADITNRLDSGDAEGVGTELLADLMKGLTPEVMQHGYRLGDVVCLAGLARAFNEALRQENRSPLHLICVAGDYGDCLGPRAVFSRESAVRLN